MGIHSCLGYNLEAVKESLYNSISGIGVDLSRYDMGFASPLTGIIERPDLKSLLDRRSRHYLAEEGEYAYIATLAAMQQAGIDAQFIEEKEVGILYGNDSSAAAVIESVDIVREKKKTALVGANAVFKAMNSTITMALSTIFGLRGINLTISGACASSSHAIGLGYILIRDGLQECIVCGGAQEVNAYAVGSFDGLGAFSKRANAPTEASRPFDKNRDGLVPGGGAATVIIESYESAIARGAEIIAEIEGYGFSSNGKHISVPNVEGPARSLRMALADAGLEASEIPYINAHATSTPVGDANEAKAIDEVFGAYKPYVTSTKCYTGHEMWMAGASEVIYSILMMKNNFIAANLNYHEGDEATSLLNIPSQRVDVSYDRFLTNSFGFGGTNSSLIIKKFKT